MRLQLIKGDALQHIISFLFRKLLSHLNPIDKFPVLRAYLLAYHTTKKTMVHGRMNIIRNIFQVFIMKGDAALGMQ